MTTLVTLSGTGLVLGVKGKCSEHRREQCRDSGLYGEVYVFVCLFEHRFNPVNPDHPQYVREKS